MADEKKVPDGPGRPPPKTKPVSVQLKDLPDFSDEKTPLDEYCHRHRDKLSEAYLAEVAESLREEKQLEPVQTAKNDRGKWELVTGHRRIAGMYILAKRGVPGFSLDMPVAALEVIGASPEDLLVRSVADNEVRQKLDAKERLLVVQKFAKAGVPKKRGAAALAISEKSYERDLRVAQQPRMLEHVLKDHLMPGDASALILAAEKQHRMQQFLDHFDGWVERKEVAIQEQDRLSKAETDKGLKAADLLVKNHLTQQVFDGWLEALDRNAGFTDRAEFNFSASFDRKSGKLRVERLNVDTQVASVLDLAKLGSKLTQLGKRVLLMAQHKRLLEQMEAAEGPQAALGQNPSPYDTDVMKEFGLSDVAELLEQELRAAKDAGAATAGGEDDGAENPAAGEDGPGAEDDQTFGQ